MCQEEISLTEELSVGCAERAPGLHPCESSPMLGRAFQNGILAPVSNLSYAPVSKYNKKIKLAASSSWTLVPLSLWFLVISLL